MSGDKPMLHSAIVSAGSCYLGTDPRPEDPADIEALASCVATFLCNSHADLLSVRSDVERLLGEDQEALIALDEVCSHAWSDSPGDLVALKRVLAECLAALQFRITWEALQSDPHEFASQEVNSVDPWIGRTAGRATTRSVASRFGCGRNHHLVGRKHP